MSCGRVPQARYPQGRERAMRLCCFSPSLRWVFVAHGSPLHRTVSLFRQLNPAARNVELATYHSQQETVHRGPGRRRRTQAEAYATRLCVNVWRSFALSRRKTARPRRTSICSCAPSKHLSAEGKHAAVRRRCSYPVASRRIGGNAPSQTCRWSWRKRRVRSTICC
jgi:hypothetical protein